MQLRERGAHPDAELRVEVRQRLVHQEGLRLADDRPAHRDALPLAARELRGLAVEEILRARAARRPRCTRRTISAFGVLPDAEPEAEVLAHAHVRVQRVVLEDHRDVAVGRLELRHVDVADRDRPLGDLLEPGDHPQERRLPAARRPDEHHELPVGDRQVDVVDGDDAAGERLRHMLELDRSHRYRRA